MEEKKTTTTRKKPSFLRTDWHKMIKLGSTVKKNRKWKGAKGRQNKIRLGRRGHAVRPKIGWGSKVETKGFVGGTKFVNVETLKDLGSLKKGEGIIISNVGLRKRKMIIEKANEKGLKILNKYLEKVDVSEENKK